MHLALPCLIALGANLTVDASQRHQTVDGVGVNVNVNSWKNGELKSALDALVDQNGASLFRVIRDPMDWVSSSSLVAQLHARDTATLTQVYEQQKMKDLWDTIAYLNQKGVRGNQVMLNFMGWTPTWIGGSGAYGIASHINLGHEADWATVVASLVYYGRRVKQLDFTLLGPLNEEDWNCLEGPCLTQQQYVDFIKALITELDAMGLTEIRVVGPDCAASPGGYLTGMMGDATIAGRTDHIGMHAYGGATSPGTSYPAANYWLTETAASCGNCDYAGTPSQGEWGFAKETTDAVIGDLSNGIAGVFIYDGYDSFYYHHNSLGFWGLLSYDAGTYPTRKRFWANAQVAKFVRPGMVRLDETDSIAALSTAAAFIDPGTGALSIVGHNDSAATMAINGQLDGFAALPVALALYETTPTADFARRADVSVSDGGAFAVSISANAFFSLASGTPSMGRPDAGSTDAGSSSDAGTPSDAGAPLPDAGASQSDAGTSQPDGGSSLLPDGGTSGPGTKGSCGCTSGADALAVALVALALRKRKAAEK